MRKTEQDTLAFSWKEWGGLASIALAPALTLSGVLIMGAIKLESRLTKIEVSSASTVEALKSLDNKTVDAIEKIDAKTDRIMALDSEVDVLKAEIGMLKDRIKDLDDKAPSP